MCFIMWWPPCFCAQAAPAPTTTARIPTLTRIVFVICSSSLQMQYEGSITGPLRADCALFHQVALGPQRLLDTGAGVAQGKPGRLAGQRLDQLGVLAGELRAHLVGDVGQRALALVPALADEPLPEELLVEHLLILALLEALLAALGDPVAARVGRVDLVDDPQFPRAIDSEFVLRIDEDETALPCPRLPGGEEVERHAGHLLPLLLRDGAAGHQLPGRDGLVVLAHFLLGARREDGALELLV